MFFQEVVTSSLTPALQEGWTKSGALLLRAADKQTFTTTDFLYTTVLLEEKAELPAGPQN